MNRPQPTSERKVPVLFQRGRRVKFATVSPPASSSGSRPTRFLRDLLPTRLSSLLLWTRWGFPVLTPFPARGLAGPSLSGSRLPLGPAPGTCQPPVTQPEPPSQRKPMRKQGLLFRGFDIAGGCLFFRNPPALWQPRDCLPSIILAFFIFYFSHAPAPAM